MIIELQRAFTPKDMREEECGVCGLPFVPESVLAQVALDNRTDMGMACPECVEYVGRRNPYRFPTHTEYEAAKRFYPEPIWASMEDMCRDQEASTFDEGPFVDAYWASWLWRTPSAERA